MPPLTTPKTGGVTTPQTLLRPIPPPTGAQPQPIRTPIPLYTPLPTTPTPTTPTVAPPAVMTARPAQEDYASKLKGFQETLTGVQRQAEEIKRKADLLAAEEATKAGRPKTATELWDEAFKAREAREMTTGSPVDTTDIDKRIADNDAKIEGAYTQYQSSIEAIRNGTVPLTALEQAQLDSIKQAFERAKAEQKIANKNYEGGLAVAGAAAGRARYAPEIESGIIKNAVDQGIQKIANLDSQMASTLADLQQAFQDKNYKRVDAVYEQYNEFLKGRAGALKQLKKDAVDFQKELQTKNIESSKENIRSILVSTDYTPEQKEEAIGKALQAGTFTFKEIQGLREDLAKEKAAAEKLDKQYAKVNKMTTAELSRLGLPQSLRGYGEDEVMDDLIGKEVPKWFIDTYRMTTGKTPLPSQLQAAWETFRLQIVTPEGALRDIEGPVSFPEIGTEETREGKVARLRKEASAAERQSKRFEVARAFPGQLKSPEQLVAEEEAAAGITPTPTTKTVSGLSFDDL